MPQTFADLGLSTSLVHSVTRQGYTEPTPVQSQAVPVLLTGRDLIATAQTGTGKTAAFTLPLLQNLAADTPEHNGSKPKGNAATSGTHAGNRTGTNSRSKNGPATPQALILAPTRELAIQIDESVATYGGGGANTAARTGGGSGAQAQPPRKNRAISHTVVFGGASKNTQATALRGNPRILVATPGRLLDFIGEGVIDLSQVAYLIIDEADRMLDMGFIPDVRRIAARTVNRRQTALFSATMPPDIETLAQELLQDPARIAIAPKKVTVDAIRQSVMHLAREHKTSLLPELIRERNMFRVLVFTRTKHRASKVAKILAKGGIPSAEIHGNRTQNQRQRALAGFRSGDVQALVGTDVAARGIDVDDITHVINYEIPHEPETYVHRIGRTARAGADGEAISMCDSEELADFRQIERLLKRSVTVDREHPYHMEPARDQRRSKSDGRSDGGAAKAAGRGPRNSGGGHKGGGGPHGGGSGSKPNRGRSQDGRSQGGGHKGGSRSRRGRR